MKKCRVWLSLIGMLVFLFPAVTKAGNVAEPYVDVSSDYIGLSPQVETVTMNTALRNLPEDSKAGILVQNPEMVEVSWVNPEENGYRQLKYVRGTVSGETVVTIYVEGDPNIFRQIRVKNSDTDSAVHYEGVGSMDFYGMNLLPMAYEVKAVAEDPNGIFGVTYQDASCNTQLLFNQVGAYKGTTTLAHGENAITLHVYATGKWTMDIIPLTASGGSTNLYGIGDAVSDRFIGDGETHNVYLANVATNGNFIVWLYDITEPQVKKTLLMNGVGTCSKYKKVTLVKDHSYYISVKSGANWAVNFQKGDPLTKLIF